VDKALGLFVGAGHVMSKHSALGYRAPQQRLNELLR
jgi:hypothetical protein